MVKVFIKFCKSAWVCSSVICMYMKNLHQLLPVVLQRRQKLFYRWNSSSYYLGEYEGFLKKYNRWSRGKPEWNAASDGEFYENVTGLTLTRPQCMTSSLFGGQKTEKLCSDWLKSCVIPSRYWEAVFVWPAYWNFSCGNASTGNSFSINAAVWIKPLFGSPINWQEIIQMTLGMANNKWIQTSALFLV